MSSTTFDILRKLLSTLNDYKEEEGKTDLVKSVLKILSTHFSLLGNNAQNEISISTDDKKELENLLYNLVDSPSCPQVK